MAYIDYEHCHLCDAKVIYDGNDDRVPDGALVFCPNCAPKVLVLLAETPPPAAPSQPTPAQPSAGVGGEAGAATGAQTGAEGFPTVEWAVVRDAAYISYGANEADARKDSKAHRWPLYRRTHWRGPWQTTDATGEAAP